MWMCSENLLRERSQTRRSHTVNSVYVQCLEDKNPESEDRLVVAGGWREGAWEKLLNRDRVFL